MPFFDVLVTGAGHAGCEAALAAARLGRTVAVVTLHRDNVGRLSCNPAIGGLGKGHLVREMDALGGAMARVTDATTLQFRRLNTRRGLAVQASRAQVDIQRYPARMRDTLLAPARGRITLVEAEVARILTAGEGVTGVELADGSRLEAGAVILTTGTFLRGLLHCGPDQTPGGRLGERPANALSESLADLGLPLGRLKTGTTPRLDSRTFRWEALERQGDTVEGAFFSFTPPSERLPRRDCWLTWTHGGTHDTIRSALHRAPLFTGAIQGRGPRYCPSIEDKVVRFPDKERHLIFLEPETLEGHRTYANGLPTSLPRDVQDAMVRTLPGLEAAVIEQYGYAVEYDFVDPRCLGPDLQHRQIRGLYLAGQVCGTSGYEEAAAQGLVAGISAARGQPFVLPRHQAYIGVLVDDLTVKGVGGEPYRMFTSRAEFRLTLREDNADRRLTPLGRELGLVDDQAWRRFEDKMEHIQRGLDLLETRLLPDAPTRARVEAAGLGPLEQPASLADLLRRPGVDLPLLVALAPDLAHIPPDAAEQVATDVKYAGYIARDRQRARESLQMEAVPIPADLLSQDLPGLSVEVRQRLRAARPATLGEASRLPGVTPAAIQVLTVYLARMGDPDGA